MNRRHAMVLLLAGLLIIPCIAASDYPVLDKQIEIRHAHLAWLTADIEVRMQVAIDYLTSHNDTQTTTLSTLLQNFKNQANSLASLTTHVALNNAIRQLQLTIADFKTELKNHLTSPPIRPLELHQAIQDALAANATTLNALKDSYWSIRTTNELAVFDQRVQRAQTIMANLTDHGYNTTQAQGILDTISGERDDLQAALSTQDETQVHVVNVNIHDQALSLRATVRGLQVQIPESQKIHYWIWVGGRAVNRTAIIITELAGLGINTTSLQTIQTQAQTDYGRAYDAYAAGNMTLARSALHDLKTDLLNLREAYHQLILQQTVTGTEQQTVTNVITALDDTTSGMTANLPET